MGVVKTAIVLFFIILSIVLGLRLLTPEDNWLCKNGEWIRHGNPVSPMPNKYCP